MGIPQNTTDQPTWPRRAEARLGCPALSRVSVMLYFAGLGTCSVIDPDEPVYGQVAKEMAAGGGWLTRIRAEECGSTNLRFLLALRRERASLWGKRVRLPVAIRSHGRGLLLMLYALGAQDFGKRAAVLACLVMATLR